MGCFSYLCKDCNKPINSDSFDGEGVKLWLLQNGEVLEEMQGNYDSYGRVFNKEWKNDWREIVDLKFNNNSNDGIVAIHTDCWDKSNKITPTCISEDDENQGWGKLKRKETKEVFHKFYSFIKKDIEKDKENNKKFKELAKNTRKLMEKAEKLLKSLENGK